jgi:hypothetical protein
LEGNIFQLNYKRLQKAITQNDQKVIRELAYSSASFHLDDASGKVFAEKLIDVIEQPKRLHNQAITWKCIELPSFGINSRKWLYLHEEAYCCFHMSLEFDTNEDIVEISFGTTREPTFYLGTRYDTTIIKFFKCEKQDFEPTEDFEKDLAFAVEALNALKDVTAIDKMYEWVDTYANGGKERINIHHSQYTHPTVYEYMQENDYIVQFLYWYERHFKPSE